MPSRLSRRQSGQGCVNDTDGKFGLSNTAPSFNGVYRKPLDQEVVGLSFNVPIFDWGLGKESPEGEGR